MKVSRITSNAFFFFEARNKIGKLTSSRESDPNRYDHFENSPILNKFATQIMENTKLIHKKIQKIANVNNLKTKKQNCISIIQAQLDLQNSIFLDLPRSLRELQDSKDLQSKKHDAIQEKFHEKIRRSEIQNEVLYEKLEKINEKQLDAKFLNEKLDTITEERNTKIVLLKNKTEEFLKLEKSYFELTKKLNIILQDFNQTLKKISDEKIKAEKYKKDMNKKNKNYVQLIQEVKKIEDSTKIYCQNFSTLQNELMHQELISATEMDVIINLTENVKKIQNECMIRDEIIKNLKIEQKLQISKFEKHQEQIEKFELKQKKIMKENEQITRLKTENFELKFDLENCSEIYKSMKLRKQIVQQENEHLKKELQESKISINKIKEYKKIIEFFHEHLFQKNENINLNLLIYNLKSILSSSNLEEINKRENSMEELKFEHEELKEKFEKLKLKHKNKNIEHHENFQALQNQYEVYYSLLFSQFLFD